MNNLHNKFFLTDSRPGRPALIFRGKGNLEYIQTAPISIDKKISAGSSYRPGMSLIEIMVFIVVIAIAVIGTSGYRYFSILDIRRSDTEITAGRIAMMLCESWKGMGGGVSTYNPINDSDDSGIGLITTASSALAPEKPLTFTLLNNGGYYKVVSDNRTYYTTMSYHTTNSPNGDLQTLNVIVTWPANPSNNDFSAGKSISLSELLIVH